MKSLPFWAAQAVANPRCCACWQAWKAPNQGKIILDGQDITKLAPYERPINMMFQSYALFPHMSVEQNIAFGLKQDKMPKGEIDARVEEMLRLEKKCK